MSRFTILCALFVCSLATGCFSSSANTEPAPGSVKPFIAIGAVKKKDGIQGPEQEAILKILTDNRTAFDTRFTSFSADAQPREVVRVFQGYLDEVSKFDVASCPVEFRGAWGRYQRAWKELLADLERLPSVYEDVEFLNALQYLFAGSTEKGKTLGGDVMASVKKVNQAHQQLYAAADVYGVIIE